MNQYNTHEIIRRNNLMLMNAMSNQVWDFHKPLDHRLAEPNLSFSQSPPCHIPSMNAGLKTKLNQGFPRLHHLTLINRTKLYCNPSQITRP